MKVIVTFDEDMQPCVAKSGVVEVSGTAESTGATSPSNRKLEITVGSAITSTRATVTVALRADTVFDLAGDGNNLIGDAGVSVSLVSTDAKLSSLVVNDGTNNATLDPAFGSATATYTATIANAVTRVTVTPTANDSCATIIGYGGCGGRLSSALPATLRVRSRRTSTIIAARESALYLWSFV